MAKGKFSALTLPPQGPMHACPPQGPSPACPGALGPAFPGPPPPTPPPHAVPCGPSPRPSLSIPPQGTGQGWGTSTPMGTMESAPGPHPDGQSQSALPTTSRQPAPQGGGSPASCWGIRLTLPLRPQRPAGLVPPVSLCSCGCLCAPCCCWRWPCTVASRTSGPGSSSWPCTYGKQPSPAGTASYSVDGRAQEPRLQPCGPPGGQGCKEKPRVGLSALAWSSTG